MITVQRQIPRNVTVAFSGGVDSMAVVDFLSQNHNVELAHFHHGNDMADDELVFVRDAAQRYGLSLSVGYGNSNPPKGVTLEEHWRNQRYLFLKGIKGPVITCHHLDDCVETYLWNALNGRLLTVPYRNGNVIRPFRLTPKAQFYKRCRGIKYFEDHTNFDPDFGTRNYIRNELMPHALKVNPGLYKVVRKHILESGY